MTLTPQNNAMANDNADSHVKHENIVAGDTVSEGTVSEGTVAGDTTDNEMTDTKDTKVASFATQMEVYRALMPYSEALVYSGLGNSSKTLVVCPLSHAAVVTAFEDVMRSYPEVGGGSVMKVYCDSSRLPSYETIWNKAKEQTPRPYFNLLLVFGYRDAQLREPEVAVMQWISGLASIVRREGSPQQNGNFVVELAPLQQEEWWDTVKRHNTQLRKERLRLTTLNALSGGDQISDRKILKQSLKNQASCHTRMATDLSQVEGGKYGRFIKFLTSHAETYSNVRFFEHAVMHKHMFMASFEVQDVADEVNDDTFWDDD